MMKQTGDPHSWQSVTVRSSPAGVGADTARTAFALTKTLFTVTEVSTAVRVAGIATKAVTAR